MRTLKKALSLVLVLAMVLSLGVSAFAVEKAADYSDYADVKNTEAVAVLTAIGVLNGNDDGTFGPEGNFTRAAAAKIIAYMTLGKTVAEALPATATEFSDVPATHWASKYIQYCADAKYIGGNGDGTFAPEGVLTATAWAKMLLCALGYDAVTEGMTGTGWEINVTRLAMNAGVASAEDMAGAFNRDAAAKLAFNTLKANVVEYKTSGTSITIGDTTINTGASDATVKAALKDNAVERTYNGTADDKLQFCEEHFKTLKLTNTSKDSFGRPATAWTVNGKAVGTHVSAAPVATFTTAMKEKDIFTTIGAEGIQGSSAKYIVMDNIYVNGSTAVVSARETSTGSGQYEAASVTDYSESVIIAKGDTSNAVGFGNGVTVEIYATETPNHYNMVVINEYLAKVGTVTKANEATGTKRSVALTVYTVGDKTFESDTLQKGDYVLVTIANGAVVSAKAAETVDGKITAYTGSTLKIDGVSYNKAQGFVAADAADFTSTFTFYLDSCGNVIRQVVKQAAVSTDYVYVVKTQYKNTVSSMLTEAAQAAKAEVIFTDGTHKVVDLGIVNDGTAASPAYKVFAPAADGTVTKGALTGDGTTATNIGNWFAYSENEDGTYTLSAISADYAKVVTSDTTLSANKTQAIGGKYTTTDTKITLVDANYVVTSSTGFKTTDTVIKSGSKILVTYAKDATTITALYAVGQDAATEKVTYAYAVAQGSTVSNGTEWTFAINGEQVTKVISGEKTPVVGKVYTLTSAAKETFTVSDPVAMTKSAQQVTLVTGKNFVAGGSIYTMADDVVIFNVDKDVATVVGETDTLEANDKVDFIVASDKVVAIWIVDFVET